VTPPTPAEPKSLAEDPESVAQLLDEAEDILNEAGPRIIDEVSREQGRDSGRRKWWPFGRAGR
jgi:predicted thioredoxin/glutaredoxin